jgi:hypothetical protein
MALLTFVLVVGLVLGCWADRTRLQRKLELATEAARFGKLKLFEDLRRPEVVGMDVSKFPEVLRFADDRLDDSSVSLLWDRVAKDREGRKCVGYYFQTAEFEEGHPGFYVLTVDGTIVGVQTQILIW